MKIKTLIDIINKSFKNELYGWISLAWTVLFIIFYSNISIDEFYLKAILDSAQILQYIIFIIKLNYDGIRTSKFGIIFNFT